VIERNTFLKQHQPLHSNKTPRMHCTSFPLDTIQLIGNHQFFWSDFQPVLISSGAMVLYVVDALLTPELCH